MKDKKDDSLVKMIQKAAWLGKEILMPARVIVKSVDETEYKITAVKLEDESESEAPEYEAYLQAVSLGEFGIIIIPEINSKVIIAFSGNKDSQAVVIQFSKVEKIVFNVNTKIEFKINSMTKFTMDIDGSILGDTSVSEPLLLGNKLKTWAQKVDQAINTITQWGAGGTPASGGMTDTGGIPPLSGVEVPSFDVSTLSQNNKVS